MKSYFENENGQVMLMTVLFLASVFLVATAAAGVLTLSQIKETNRVIDSTKAVFAADTAIEKGLFKVFRCNDTAARDQSNIVTSPVCINAGEGTIPDLGGTIPGFFNGAGYDLLINGDPNCPLSSVNTPSTLPDALSCIKATGRSGGSARAFQISFQ